MPDTSDALDIAAARKKYFVSSQKSELAEEHKLASEKRFTYLIGLTEIFKHFIDARAAKDEDFRELVSKLQLKPKQKATAGSDHRHRKTEKQEDSELLDGDDGEQDLTVFTESPAFIDGKMRDYQVQGLNWMVSLHANHISGILADEMGLGKTLQTVSFLGYLRYIKHIPGPHLVLVPKTTLENWQREFAKWTPEVETIVVQGDKELRENIIQKQLLKCKFDVCITSYEIVMREKAHFRRFAWQYIVIDEAHRIKNEESQLSQIIRMFSTRNRLLVTGTPLQNNLHELWALLNYILPDIFADKDTFDEWFNTQDADQDEVVKKLHQVLRPFLLRRVKAEVEHSLLPKKEINLYVGMTEMQRRWYQNILQRDIDAVNGAVKKSQKSRLLNIVMQLRKCCNHPYLFEGAEPKPFTTDEHLVNNCGKLMLLDQLLKKCQERGSRVLIFSQMSRLLDILEDYCFLRGHQYCRIDGSTDHESRINAIDEYNKPNSEKFLFLLTTRAGGLGINLVTADTVVIYDSDWNPQADLQAMDRAHRIGQTKQVHVYRFVTESSVEEKVLERAAKKLRLDQLVIQQGRANGYKTAAEAAGDAKDDLVDMIRHGAQDIIDKKNKAIDSGFDIDQLLQQGEERTAALNSRYEALGLDDLSKFDGQIDSYQWEGDNYKKDNRKVAPITVQMAKRERRGDYSVERYFKGFMKGGERGPRAPKAPKQLNLQDHQFWPQRLYDLQDQETAYHQRRVGYKAPLAAGTPADLEQRKLDQALEQYEIDHAEPLTEAEEEEKKDLSYRGYSNWSRRDFTAFVNLMASHGRDNLEAVAAHHEKSLHEIEVYHEAFWRRISEIELFERYQGLVEAGQEKAERLKLQRELIKRKVEMYDAPLQQLQLDLPAANAGRRTYSEDEDRFLVVMLYTIGVDSSNLYDQIREAIRESPLFRFDWFFLSRTPQEIARRCQTLVGAITRELGEKQQ